MKLVECVPNISEGRNAQAIESLADIIAQYDEVHLLHVDSNSDANRTVFTFAGELQAVSEAAFMLTQTAISLIDMRKQSGEHVRNGAVDVCPIIPVQNVSMQECVAEANLLGRRIGALGVPVYLYAEAATQPCRRELSILRKGQYPALRQKLSMPKWKPDFGPANWNETVAQSGSTQVGARPFLIALNVNLKTKNVRVARKIARIVRSSGHKQIKGEFCHLKADGWYMEKYGCAQITMNFTNYEETSIHTVFDRISALAKKLGTETNGAELIGLIPEASLLAAGRHYCAIPPNKHDNEIIDCAINALGLHSVGRFHKDKRIFETVFASQSKQSRC